MESKVKRRSVSHGTHAAWSGGTGRRFGRRWGGAGTIVALVLMLAARGASAQERATRPAASRPALNKYCPVMPEEEADPNITTVYKGRTIAFCCDNCLKKFKANPERYFARLVSRDVSREEETGEIPAAGAHHHDQAESGSADLDHDDDEHAGDEGGAAGHEHGEGEDRPPLLARLHPIIVHFPIAGVPLALLGFLAWVVSRRPAFALADVVPLGIAAVAAVAAVVTGNMAHDSMRFSPTLQNYAHWHQYVATTVMVLLLLLAGLRLWRWNALTGGWLRLYGAGLVVVCLLIGLVGYLGGALVFGPDHLAW